MNSEKDPKREHKKGWKRLVAVTLALLLAMGGMDLSGFAVNAKTDEENTSPETKLLITAFAELDSEITEQQLPVGASQEDIVFPDTLTVTVKQIITEADTKEQEASQSIEESSDTEENSDTGESSDTEEDSDTEESSDTEEDSDTEEQSSDTEETEAVGKRLNDEQEAVGVEKLLSALTPMKVCAAEGTETQLTLTGITWKIDPEESDGDTFDSSEDSSGKCYVYVPVLPGTDAEGNELLLDEDAELPMLYVLIGEHGIMLAAPPPVSKTYLKGMRIEESIDLSFYIENLKTVTKIQTESPPESPLRVKFEKEPFVEGSSLKYTISSDNPSNSNEMLLITINYKNNVGQPSEYELRLVITIQSQHAVQPASSVTYNGTLTYGEDFSKLTFQPVTFVGDEGEVVSGKLEWNSANMNRTWDANVTPDGTWIPGKNRFFSCFFTPDNSLYEQINEGVEVKIYPAKPTIAQAPVLPALERRETPYKAEDIINLSELAIKLTDIEGNAFPADKIEWKWKGSENTTDTKNWSVGQHTETIVATYTGDTDNYQPVEIPVTITVKKATPQVTGVAASANYEHGAYLREQTLNGTVTDKDGKPIKAEIVWKSPNTQLSVSDNGKEYEYICIPHAAEDYDRVEGMAVVTVNKLPYPPNQPATYMNVSKSCDVVSRIALPTDWQWIEMDKDKQLAVDAAAVSVTAEYTGADKGNYENTTVTVSVKRSFCEHTKTSDVIANLEPTCTLEGIGLIECASGCGFPVRKNIPLPKIAHDYQRRTPDLTREESELFAYYRCSVCGKEYITAAPPPAQEGSSEGSVSESSGDSGSSDDTSTTVAVTPASQNKSREPFITSDTGAQGWAAIREYVQKAEEDSVITVSMNGESVVPADVMELIRGKAVMLAFDMGDGTAWVVSGLLMTAAAEGIPTVVYYEDELQGKLLFTIMTLTAEEAPIPVYYADYNKGTLTPADMAVMKTAAMQAHLYAYGKQCFAILYELGRSTAQTP